MKQTNVALSVVLVLLLFAQGQWCDLSVAPVCGKRNSERDLAIDDHSQYGEFPWMVLILKKELVFTVAIRVYKCGGSLIHPKVVLTAAHSVDDVSAARLVSRLGLGNHLEKNPHQDRNVSEIVLHPEYSENGLRNDVALLFLESPVTLHEGIRTICLPPPEATFDTQRCFVSGWGLNAFAQRRANSALVEKGEVTEVPTNECQSSLRSAFKTILGSQFLLHSSFICAGTHDRMEAGNYDGSPLVCPMQGSDQQQYQQVGIFVSSFGRNAPSTYASVALVRSWIDQKMQNKTLDTRSYDPQTDHTLRPYK